MWSLSVQTKYLIKPYLEDQADINAKMRAILVDWLVDVHTKFRLVPETLYLCVRLTDKYCSLADVPRSKLQLVGVTALLLACKHEEIYPPEVRDCVYITGKCCNTLVAILLVNKPFGSVLLFHQNLNRQGLWSSGGIRYGTKHSKGVGVED